MKLTGENRSTRGGKPVPVPLCPPQIPHGLDRDGTLASAVICRRLTALAMARPKLVLIERSFSEQLWKRLLCFSSFPLPSFYSPSSAKCDSFVPQESRKIICLLPTPS
jgi:hypothetical protein